MCLVKSLLIENLENNYYKTNRIKMKWNSFYWESITPYQNKDITWKLVSLMHEDEKMLKKIATQIQWHIKNIIYHKQMEFILAMQDWFKIQKKKKSM